MASGLCAPRFTRSWTQRRASQSEAATGSAVFRKHGGKRGLQIPHDLHQCIRQRFSRPCNSSSELNQARDTMWMRNQVRRQLRHPSLLSFDVKQDIGWSWEKFPGCVADYTK